MAELIADPFRAARLLLTLRQEGVTDPDVLAAMETIGRDAFVDDPALSELAFEDTFLPIPCGQVMLRPTATGHLLQALKLKPAREARCLLVGFGSGYMAALLAQIAGHVCAVDRYRGLVEEGRARLERLGIANVTVAQMDGLEGWAAQGPYDAIVLAGAVPEVPEALLGQLAKGGVLAVPLLASGATASILCLDAAGAEIERRDLFQWLPPLAEGIAQVL